MDSKQEQLNSIYERLLAIGRCKNKKDFATLLGVSYTGLTRAMNGDEHYLTSSLLSKAIALVAIEGYVPIEEEIAEVHRVRLLPYEARGGTIGDFVDAVHDYDCETVISPLPKADFAMEIVGNSMAPEFSPGDRILIKRIDPNLFIEWGRVYVLDTDNGAVIKQIRKTDNPEEVECVSLNPAFQSFTIPVNAIRGWYRVLMSMSMK